MTSRNRGATECFVYMTLPGETAAVPAGRFALNVDRNGVSTGRFVYGRSYLALPNAVEIDPVELKLSARTYETVLMKGMFGALRDALKRYREKGWPATKIIAHFGVSPDMYNWRIRMTGVEIQMRRARASV